MKDFRDRFVRSPNPEEQNPQPPQPRSYIGPSHPQPVEPAPRPEAPAARPERPEKPARSGFLPVPAGKNPRGAAQTTLVHRSLVTVWSDRSFLTERVGTVQNGELLTILVSEDDWMQIRCGTRLTGWVRTAELAAYQDPYAGLGEREDIL
jgi:hypothetical protein